MIKIHKLKKKTCDKTEGIKAVFQEREEILELKMNKIKRTSPTNNSSSKIFKTIDAARIIAFV